MAGNSASGRRAAPAPLKLLKGRGEGKDSAGREVLPPPAFERCAPDPPEFLSELARQQWQLCAPRLDKLDLLKPEDQAIFTAFCEAWATYVTTLEALREAPLVKSNASTGMPHLNPLMKAMSQAQNDLLRFAREFGLSPASEGAVSRGVPEVDGDDPFAG